MNGNPRIPAIQRQRQFSGRGPGSGRGSGLRPTGAVIYFVPAWGWSPAEAARFPDRPSAPLPPEPQRLTGRLRLELQAGVVPQIYVDGYYVGTFDEFNGELILEAGPHRIELRADRYEPLQVDVQIFPDRSITYRGALKASAAPAPSSASAPPPAPPAAPASVTPPPPSTIYVIPGCYVGNLPPRDAGLRADCDERLTIEFPPRP